MLKKAKPKSILPFSFFSRKMLEQKKFFVLLQPNSKGF